MVTATSVATVVRKSEEGQRDQLALIGLDDLIERPLVKLDDTELATEANRIIGEVNELGQVLFATGWPRVLYLGQIWIAAKSRHPRTFKQWFDDNIKGRSFRSAQDDMRLVKAVDEGGFDPKNADSAHLPVYRALRLLTKANTRKKRDKKGGTDEIEAEFKAIKMAYENATKASRERFHDWLRDHHGLHVIPAEQLHRKEAESGDDHDDAPGQV